MPSPSRAAPAPRSAAPAKLGRGRAARFFEVLTAAWRRPRAARGRAARAKLVGRKLAHPAVPSPSLSVPASSTQPTSGLLNPILRGYTLIVFLLFSSLPGRLKFRAIDSTRVLSKGSRLVAEGKTKGFIKTKSLGWVEGWVGLRVGFININDMYNNDVGKGGVWAYEAYEVK